MILDATRMLRSKNLGARLCMVILANRHIKVCSQCPICKQGVEDIRYLMFTCNRAKKIWKSLGLDEVIDKALLLDRSGSMVFEELLRSPRKKSHVPG
jgi:hypothetical protein